MQQQTLLTLGAEEFESCKRLWIVTHILLEVTIFEKYLKKLDTIWLHGRGGDHFLPKVIKIFFTAL